MQTRIAGSLCRSAQNRRLFSTAGIHRSHVGSKSIELSPSVSFSFLQPTRLGVPEAGENQSPSWPNSVNGNLPPHAPRRPLLASTDHSPLASVSVLQVSGPKGTQSIEIPDGIHADITPSSSTTPSFITLTCSKPNSRAARSSWGLTRALLANAVQGVTEGFSVRVRLVGVGYRASVEEVQADGPSKSTTSNAERSRAHQISDGKPTHASSQHQLVLRLGYPRPVRITIPPQLICKIPSPTEIEIEGQDKQLLGKFAADIRRWRVPEPYNGKGIFVGSESVRRKEVKKK